MRKESPVSIRKGNCQVVICLIGLTLGLGLYLSYPITEARAQGTAEQPQQVTAEQVKLQRIAEDLSTQELVREAVQVYQRILEVDPNFVPALKDLAWIRATRGELELRHPAEAVRLAERAFDRMIIEFNSRKDRDAVPPNSDRVHVLQVGAALSAAYAAAKRFQAPLDPDLTEKVQKGELSERQALTASGSSGLGAVEVATWVFEMAQALERRSPSAETAKLVQDVRALLELYLAGRSVDDSRPQPGVTRR
jgi:hypothetical protein